jgi:hypothetical protein
MHVDYMVLADAAATEGGKHYIHGAGWNRLSAASFPVTHPSMSVAVRLHVPWHDTNRPHQLELDVVNEDGQSALPPPGPLQGTITAGRPPYLQEGEEQFVPLVMTIVQMQFNQPGLYAVILRIDGMEAGRSAFRVVSLRPQPAPA